MLPSVAGVDITACMFDPALLWLCVVITAYLLYLRNIVLTCACVDGRAVLRLSIAGCVRVRVCFYLHMCRWRSRYD